MLASLFSAAVAADRSSALGARVAEMPSCADPELNSFCGRMHALVDAVVDAAPGNAADMPAAGAAVAGMAPA